MGAELEKGRPSKYTPERIETILESLRNGCTRGAASAAADINQSTLCEWIALYPDFSANVETAEGMAEGRFTAAVVKAAQGWPTGSTTRQVKTVLTERTTVYPDGRKVTETVPVEHVTETVMSSAEWDWRASIEWLKRRRRKEWGDSIDIRRMEDDQLARMLEQDTYEREQQIPDRETAIEK